MNSKVASLEKINKIDNFSHTDKKREGADN